VENGEMENFLNPVVNQFYISANPGKLIVKPISHEPVTLGIFSKTNTKL
jgi:hypothetical protein